MKFVFFRQPDSMDCGPTCLQMIANFYGKRTSLQLLRERSQLGKEGVSMLGLSEAAESIGFKTQAVTLSYGTLVNDAKLPCILHWNRGHFVVLYRAKKEFLFIADPAHGLMKIPKKEFIREWIYDKRTGRPDEGIALLLEPSSTFHDSDLDLKDETSELVFTNIFNYLSPYKKLITQLLFGLAIASILQTIMPFLTQAVVDFGINTSNMQFVYIVLLAQTALILGKLLTELIRSWILLHVSSRINISILTDFLIKLMKLPLSFFESKKTGDILQRMNDHQRIESFLTGSSINLLFSLINLFIFSIVLAMFNIYIFSTFLTSTLLYSFWIFIFLKKRRTLDYKRFELASKERSVTIQLIQGMQEIKLHGIERPMRWNWERLQAKLFNLSMKDLSLNQWQQSGASLINEGKNIFVTFLSAKAVIDGQMTIGAMLSIQYIIGQLNSPIEQMIGFIKSWQSAKISMERLNEIHKMNDEEAIHDSLLQQLPMSFGTQLLRESKPPVAKDYHSNIVDHDFQLLYLNNKNAQISNSQSGITFHDVTFTYSGSGNEPVLKHIALTIPKGKTTAIVGTSGSGKTTLLKLLLKFYEPQKGEIKLDGTPLSNISHRIWRNHCGAVMQDSFIFSDTIARNIAIGDEKIDINKLHHAAAMANIEEFAHSLPRGFNTKIGPEGMNVSMGQKQRVLIARAIYRNPEFIFFDEATNSLDAENERTITNNLSTFFKDKTVVVVAHRLSTVKNADQIVVINNGKITELGSHHALLNLKGEYASLIKDQLYSDG